jgi:hypothetical protein
MKTTGTVQHIAGLALFAVAIVFAASAAPASHPDQADSVLGV